MRENESCELGLQREKKLSDRKYFLPLLNRALLVSLISSLVQINGGDSDSSTHYPGF